jgi:hypothetical protein
VFTVSKTLGASLSGQGLDVDALAKAMGDRFIALLFERASRERLALHPIAAPKM